MKKLALALAIACVTTLNTFAAPLKIGIVDMKKVYKEFYKTRINEAELEKDKAAARSELDKRDKKLTSILEERAAKLKTLRGTQEGTTARANADKDYRSKEQEAMSLARDRDEFGRRRQRMLGDKARRMQDEIIIELQEIVSKNSAGYDLVFDKTGESSTQVPVMVFSKDAIDFTEKVIAAANVNAPADTPEAPADGPVAPETPTGASATKVAPTPEAAPK